MNIQQIEKRMVINADHGNVSSTNNPRFFFARFIWFFFTALCVISILTFGHLVSTVRSIPPLSLRDVDENYGHDSPMPFTPLSIKAGHQRQRQQRCGIWMAPSSLRPFPGRFVDTMKMNCFDVCVCVSSYATFSIFLISQATESLRLVTLTRATRFLVCRMRFLYLSMICGEKTRTILSIENVVDFGEMFFQT